MASFKINHRTIQEYLDGQHGVEELLEREAQASLQRAQESAPVVSGDYRDSLHIETLHTDRLVKRVVADVDYALEVEANHGTLARSI